MMFVLATHVKIFYKCAQRFFFFFFCKFSTNLLFQQTFLNMLNQTADESQETFPKVPTEIFA